MNTPTTCPACQQSDIVAQKTYDNFTIWVCRACVMSWTTFPDNTVVPRNE